MVTRRRQQKAYGPLLVTGATGFLGGYVLEALSSERDVVTCGRVKPPGSARHVEGDLRDGSTYRDVERLAPAAVLHLAAVSHPDRCEADPALARAVNEEASSRLARHVGASCRRFLYLSTDLVFDGEEGGYAESAEPRPLSVYGATKLAGERAVRAILGARSTVVRLALLYGVRTSLSSRPSFAEAALEKARRGESVDLFTDQLRSPLYAEDAALGLRALLELAAPPETVHLGGPERLSRYDMGLAALRAFGLPGALARPCLMSERPSAAPRPRDVSLDVRLASRLGLKARPLEEGLEEMKRKLGASGS